MTAAAYTPISSALRVLCDMMAKLMMTAASMGFAALYGFRDLAWNAERGHLRPISGIITLHRAPMHAALCVLHALCYGLISDQAESMAMLMAGVGVTCFDVDEYPRAHLGFLLAYFGATALAIRDPMLHAVGACGVVWLCVRRAEWDSVLTCLELLWVQLLLLALASPLDDARTVLHAAAILSTLFFLCETFFCAPTAIPAETTAN